MLDYPNKIIKEQMELVREYSRVFHLLRKRLGIPLSQPLLDFSYGIEYLFPDFIDILGEEINIYNSGYNYSDKNSYWLLDICEPKCKDWETERSGSKWVALNVNIPNWLKEVYEKRRIERKNIFKKKYAK